jgi:hypothetical protein
MDKAVARIIEMGEKEKESQTHCHCLQQAILRLGW